jgi:hypothetical protein
MKQGLLIMMTVISLLLFPTINFAQAPNLGSAVNFVLFSTNGAVTNTGISHLTGNVGTNNGSSTGFGNVNGVMADGGPLSAQCAVDLLIAYNQLNSTIATFFPAALLGNGQILVPGVYSISSAATLNGNLTLNGNNNPNAVFIIKIQGSFSTNAAAKVKLINGAKACNVYWKVEGLVSMATKTSMKGTVIANNAAINMNALDTLEGRALSTTGKVTVDGVLAYTPIGCGSPVLTGPVPPALASTECYALFSANGAVSNTGITTVTGDVGTNVGLTTGFDTSLVTGKVHLTPDLSTAQCAADLSLVYNYLNTLPYDINLLYPAQFGNNLVLTPHTYLLDAATVFTDTLILDAQGNADGVFVFLLNGALSTSTYATVKLINGAQAKNVFWKIEGAVGINNYSYFCGTIVCHNGSLGAINTGVVINGRLLTTNGALTTAAITAIMPEGCTTGAPVISKQPGSRIACEGTSVSLSVTAHGTDLTYQWRKGNVNLNNGGNISGAKSAILTFNPVKTTDEATNYNVIVTGTQLPSDTSIDVSLTVNSSPEITTQPADKIGCIGEAVSFYVAATGVGVSYQWRKGNANLTNGGNISGVNTALLAIDTVTTADFSNDYYVVVTGACQPKDTSVRVSLTECLTGIGSLSTIRTNAVSIYPNPFKNTLQIRLNDVAEMEDAVVYIYNILGVEMSYSKLTQQVTSLETNNLSSGIYLYKVMSKNKTVQSGRLISQQ